MTEQPNALEQQLRELGDQGDHSYIADVCNQAAARIRVLEEALKIAAAHLDQAANGLGLAEMKHMAKSAREDADEARRALAKEETPT